MADINDELTEEEQRFENMLDGVEEEWDERIRKEEERQHKDMLRSITYAVIGVAGIIICLALGYYFDLYTVS